MSGRVVDFLADDKSLDEQEKAYEGVLGKLYAAYMDSPLLQSLDSWILGLSNRSYKKWFLERTATIDGPFVEVPVGRAPFLTSAPVYKKHPWIGVDISKTLLTSLDAKCKRHGVEDYVLIRASVTALPLKTAKAPAVISLFGFHCFPDKASAFSEIGRVLKVGGSFILSTLSAGYTKLADSYLKMFEAEGSFSPCISPTAYRSLLDVDFHLERERRMGAVYLSHATVRDDVPKGERASG